jgi:hypothetical protein
MTKFQKVSNYKVGQKDELGRWKSEEYIIQNPTYAQILELLEEGPCKVTFNRVYYKKTGIRDMTCVRPMAGTSKKFIQRYPGLILVIDLNLKEYRSMYYHEIITLERLRKKDVSYGERKLVSKIRGQNWDYLWPGDEGESLRPDSSDRKRQGFV